MVCDVGGEEMVSSDKELMLCVWLHNHIGSVSCNCKLYLNAYK